MSRKVTNQLLDLIDEGVLSADIVLTAALKYMSEDEVADMAHINEFIEEEEDEDNVDEDDDYEARCYWADCLRESYPDQCNTY